MGLPIAILIAEIALAAFAIGIVLIKAFGPPSAKKVISRVSHQLHLHGWQN